MAFDGITIANIVNELNDTILNGRIAKIAQPENDELLLTIKPAKGQVRLVISASASLPLIYLSRDNKPSPMTAPNFCMLLRKHIANGRIVGISQPSLERIIRFEIEHLDELGDLCRKSLIVEIMGKHSNIIFCNEKGMIIDSIKHVSAQMSSVREVLPGREYFIPDTMKKENPLDIPEENFTQELLSKPMPVGKAIYNSFTGISPVVAEVIRTYYSSRDLITRIRQKSSDLRRVVQTALERNRKKYDLQLKQLRDTENRDKYKVYGELIHTYGYNLEDGAKELEALNYYTNEMIKIPLDPQKTPQENAKKYFDRYNKQKRTFEALSELIKETKDEIDYLESVSKSLDIARSEDDLIQIKEELIESGFIRRKQSSKKVKITSKPFHYISSDGFHMYVGKNNLQNEELTFHFANGGDWWFHAKKAPGSHVIVKTNGEELPDRTFEEAARLAAHYSKNSGAEKVEVDYVEKKQVKKPNGSKPGFVVYYTNYSMMIDSDISGIQEVL